MNIHRVFLPVQGELARVAEEMAKLIDTRNPRLREAAHYFSHTAGKKMRPALVLLAGKCCGDKLDEQAIRAAVALEFIHLASLVHDDVIDRSHKRRGIDTVNKRWDDRTAVLLGDYFFGKALGQAAKCGTIVVNMVAELVECLVSGECSQWEDIANLLVSEEDYYQRIEMKTARFVAICCRVGAMTGEATADQQDALAEYGKYLGMAYQIRDDILDLIGDEQTIGKPVFSDLSNGHITLPVIHALRAGQYRQEMVDLLNADTVQDRSQWPRINYLLNAGGSFAYTMDKLKMYVHLAKKCLQPLPKGMGYQSLCHIADFTARRMV